MKKIYILYSILFIIPLIVVAALVDSLHNLTSSLELLRKNLSSTVSTKSGSSSPLESAVQENIANQMDPTWESLKNTFSPTQLAEIDTIMHTENLTPTQAIERLRAKERSKDAEKETMAPVQPPKPITTTEPVKEPVPLEKKEESTVPLSPESPEQPLLPPPPPPPSLKPPPPPPLSPSSKPIAKKPTYQVPLTQQELDALTEDQKKQSDGFIVSAIDQLSEYEYDQVDDALRKFTAICELLRKDPLFLKRAELQQLCVQFHKDGFGLKVAKVGLQELVPNKDNQRLLKIEDSSSPLARLIQAFKDTLFNPALLNKEYEQNLLIFATSFLTAYRGNIGDTKESQQQRSDQLFLNTIRQFQDDYTAGKSVDLDDLSMRLNALRLNEDFLLYKKMLKSLTVKSGGGLQQEPIITILREPYTNKLIIYKSSLSAYLFDKMLLSSVLNDAIMSVLLSQHYEKAQRERQLRKPPLAQFMNAMLLKFKGLSGLNLLLNAIIKEYPANSYNEEAMKALKSSLADATINSEESIRLLESVGNISLSESAKAYIKDQIESTALDSIIISLLEKSFIKPTPWLSLKGLLEQRYPTSSTRPPKVEALLSLLDSMWTTPRDLWVVLDKPIQKSLLAQGKSYTEFQKAFNSYSLLLMAVQFLIDEYKRGAESWANYLTLRKALQMMNKGVLPVAVIPTLRKRVHEQLTKEGVSKPFIQPAAFGKEAGEMLPFVLLDYTLSGQDKGVDYYTGEIKNGSLVGKLTSLDAALAEWNVVSFINKLTFYLSNFGQKDLHKQQLESFMHDLSIALTAIFSQLNEYKKAQEG